MKLRTGLFVILVVMFAALEAGAASFSPAIDFSGAPSYVTEFDTSFRDNGGPLSPYGSHVGVKAEVREMLSGGVHHYACATGKNILDYSRTGLFGTSWFELEIEGKPALPESREIVFEYYGWTETADYGNMTATTRVFFHELDTYIIDVTFANKGESVKTIVLSFNLEKEGRYMRLVGDEPYGPHNLGFSVSPIFTFGKNWLAVTQNEPATSSMKKGVFSLDFEEAELSPGEAKDFWLVFAYSSEGPVSMRRMAEPELFSLSYADTGWDKMEKEREEFFSMLPPPHLSDGQEDYLALYRMSATALDNLLYSPQGSMEHWACVPSKVHYNWFWLWDSGFQSIGYAEWDPVAARDVILTMLDAQRKDGFVAHMADERGKPLTPHSQPPVFGYAGLRVMDRFPYDPVNGEFITEMYEKSVPFIQWWERKRDVNDNGLFEYISQDEGGWDNSPRANYVRKLIFIPYYGYLGELIGSKIKPLDSVDLNSWMYSYYRAMQRFAASMGEDDEAQVWRAEAVALAARVDKELWSEERGCWLDTWNRIGSKKRKHFDILTPHIWYPASVGATMDEDKARRVIEEHLLNPDEFYGEYPIPTVAYNSEYFDRSTNGWTSSIWLVTTYSALEALARFGYDEEAADLRERTLSMMADQDGMMGIYETYDALKGTYKNEFSDGTYSSFQFGWSSAFTMEIILERYQAERFIFENTTGISGFVRRAETFSGREDFYLVEAGLDVPRVKIESADGKPLLQSSLVSVTLADPYDAASSDSYMIWLWGERFEVELGKETVLQVKGPPDALAAIR